MVFHIYRVVQNFSLFLLYMPLHFLLLIFYFCTRLMPRGAVEMYS